MKTDWEIHLVTDNVSGKSSAHTHGLDKYGSLEVEINLHLRPEVMGQYLNFISSKIADGFIVKEGEKVTGLFECPIYFIKTQSVQSEEEVLRVILPDEEMRFPWDDNCSSGYREQIEPKHILKRKDI